MKALRNFAITVGLIAVFVLFTAIFWRVDWVRLAHAVVCTALTDCTGAGNRVSGDDWNAMAGIVNANCQAHMAWESPTTADEFVFRLPPFAGTMTQVDCEAYGGTSFTIDICDGEDTGDDTCTTSILGSPLTCTTSGASDSSLSATGFAAKDKVTLVVTAVTGSVNLAEVMISCTPN